MSVPALLRPWAEELEGLDPELVSVLGEPLRQLTRMVGAPSAPRPGPTGEPDGFDGLTRRGPLDRLLLSEWALAEAAPLEFLRRATQAEQSFLQLRRLDPASSRRCVVLLDAPPSQHGEARLMHLVALVVLAARARRGGLAMSWGLLQEGRLHPDLSVDSLSDWRHGARWRPGDATHLQAWLDRLCLDDGDELWLVGGPELPAHRHRIVVEEPLGLDPALDVSVGSRRARVPLPPADPAARLFRRPAGPPRPQRGIAAGAGPLWFGLSGDRLFVPTDGRVLAYHVPNSPAAAEKGAGKMQVIEGEHLLAVGYRKRRKLLVDLRGFELFMRPLGLTRPMTPDLAVPDEPSLCVELDRSLFFVDGAAQLWRLPEGERCASDVLAMGKNGVLAVRDGRTVQLTWGRLSASPHDLGPEARRGLISGHGVALSYDEPTWWVGEHQVHLHPDDLVGGTMYIDGATSLVFAHGDDVMVSRSAGTRCVATGREVVAVAVHPTRAIVAWRERSGRIVAYHTEYEVELLRVGPSSEPS